MTTLSHLCNNTGASELANAFKLSDWIGVINWTHLPQSVSSILTVFFCSGVIKLKLTP